MKKEKVKKKETLKSGRIVNSYISFEL